jgi:F0F1-type ATP synthase membrane subunit b/b'
MPVPDATLTLGTLIPLLSIFMSGLIVLVLVVGLTARFALKPAVEALGALRALPVALAEVNTAARQVEELSRAVQQLEQQLHRARLQAGEVAAVEV